jgi:hypothetical protein
MRDKRSFSVMSDKPLLIIGHFDDTSLEAAHIHVEKWFGLE